MKGLAPAHLQDIIICMFRLLSASKASLTNHINHNMYIYMPTCTPAIISVYPEGYLSPTSLQDMNLTLWKSHYVKYPVKLFMVIRITSFDILLTAMKYWFTS